MDSNGARRLRALGTNVIVLFASPAALFNASLVLAESMLTKLQQQLKSVSEVRRRYSSHQIHSHKPLHAPALLHSLLPYLPTCLTTCISLPPLLSRLYSPCLAHVSPRGLASASSCTSPVSCPHGPSSSGLSEHPQAQTHGEPRQAHRVCIVYASCMHRVCIACSPPACCLQPVL